MIDFIIRGKNLILFYQVEFGPPEWALKELELHNSVKIVKTYHFEKKHLIKRPELVKEALNPIPEFATGKEEYSGGEYEFVLGKMIGDYYKIDKAIFDINNDVFIHVDFIQKLLKKHFTSINNVSIISRIGNLVENDIVIGGDRDGAIPFEEYDELVSKFPTIIELRHYTSTRIYHAFKNYLDFKSDAQKKFDSYLTKRLDNRKIEQIPQVYDWEVAKYEFIRAQISNMLSESEKYTEDNWQKIMLQFLLVIFPKYVAVLEKLNLKDFYTDPSKTTKRQLDITLIDTNGYIDIIEIKKPFENSILYNSKYRDNYVPTRELSGSIMQAEKYLFHLSKWGKDGEEYINSKKITELPSGLKVKIANPKALIIMGRSNDFIGNQQKVFDFELIKRKYANMVDIITYDDLLARLDRIIEKFRKLS